MLRFAATRKLNYQYPITIQSADGTVKKTFNVVLCATENDRQLGLMGQQLPDRCGALLDFGSECQPALWMKNCLHPLCAVYISADSKVIGKQLMDPSQPTTLHHAPDWIRYVLEVHPSDAEAIANGDVVHG